MKYAILSCDVFKDELEKYVPNLENKPVQIRYFEVSLHIYPDKMREHLLTELENFDDEGITHILCLFGLCGNASLGISSDKYTLVMPRVHECIALFLGSTQSYLKFKKDNPYGYFASPGWAKILPGEVLYEQTKQEYIEKYGDDDEELIEELMDAFMEQYKEYKEFFYVDFTNDKCSEKKCEDCAKFMNWKFKYLDGDDCYFKDAIEQNWTDEKFLILEKGKEIKASYDERIFL